MDYRELLKKYMQEVVRQEGITFIDYATAVSFTAEELSELRVIADEVFGSST